METPKIFESEYRFCLILWEHELVEKRFEGSLPAFVAAFTRHSRISKKEIDAVQQMIDSYRDRYSAPDGKGGSR